MAMMTMQMQSQQKDREFQLSQQKMLIDAELGAGQLDQAASSTAQKFAQTQQYQQLTKQFTDQGMDPQAAAERALFMTGLDPSALSTAIRSNKAAQDPIPMYDDAGNITGYYGGTGVKLTPGGRSGAKAEIPDAIFTEAAKMNTDITLGPNAGDKFLQEWAKMKGVNLPSGYGDDLSKGYSLVGYPGQASATTSTASPAASTAAGSDKPLITVPDAEISAAQSKANEDLAKENEDLAEEKRQRDEQDKSEKTAADKDKTSSDLQKAKDRLEAIKNDIQYLGEGGIAPTGYSSGDSKSDRASMINERTALYKAALDKVEQLQQHLDELSNQ